MYRFVHSQSNEGFQLPWPCDKVSKVISYRFDVESSKLIICRSMNKNGEFLRGKICKCTKLPFTSGWPCWDGPDLNMSSMTFCYHCCATCDGYHWDLDHTSSCCNLSFLLLRLQALQFAVCALLSTAFQQRTHLECSVNARQFLPACAFKHVTAFWLACIGCTQVDKLSTIVESFCWCSWCVNWLQQKCLLQSYIMKLIKSATLREMPSSHVAFEEQEIAICLQFS